MAGRGRYYSSPIARMLANRYVILVAFIKGLQKQNHIGGYAIIQAGAEGWRAREHAEGL